MGRKLTQREKLSLAGLAVALLLVLGIQGGLPIPGLSGMGQEPIRDAEETYLTTQVQARQESLVAAELAVARQQLEQLESRLLVSENAALAQAEMRSLVGDLLTAEGIGMDSSRFGRPEREQEHYARVPLAVVFRCGVDQLVNFLATLANAPKLLTPRQIQIAPANPQTKFLQVSMTVAGYLPIERTPELAPARGGSR